MIKILQIHSCSECKHIVRSIMTNCRHPEVGKNENLPKPPPNNIMNIGSGIPTWCPLTTFPGKGFEIQVVKLPKE